MKKFIHSRPQNRSLQSADGAWPLSISLQETAGFSPRSFILILIIVSLFLPIALAQTQDWHTTKSTHFVVYYKNAPEGFLKRLIERAENHYDKIADDLGFRRFNFWLWDNRAKIYIYDDAQDYQAATGQPSWSAGCARVKDKIIYTFPYAQGFFGAILPHEMGHIIFREFVGFDNYAVPLWLDEGVASYQEIIKFSMANKLVREAIDNGNFISVEKLSSFNPQLIQDKTLVNLFYAEAVSIIVFLIKEFGQDDFVYFCQNLRDKKNLEMAMASTYPFKNIQELEQAWRKYLRK